ncbi:MAG: CHAD domain-containing protein [Acidimicrobiales bacterium]
MRTTFAHPDHNADDVVEALAAWGFSVSPARRSSRTAVDTFDGRLRAAGLQLELHDGPTPELVLWSADEAPPAHLPHGGTPTWPSEMPAGPLRSRLSAVTRERALLPLLSVESRSRSARRVDRRGKTTVVVDVHDELVIVGDEPALWPGTIAEVTSAAGHADAAETATRRLRTLGLEAGPGSLIEAVAQAVGKPIAGHDSSPTVPLQASDDALAAVRRVLANLATTIDANLQGTIEDIDPEFLHELRVAVRRTRSVLTQAGKVLPPDVREHHRESFGRLGQVTGPARDLDVYLLGWDDYVSPLGEVDRAHLDPVRTALETRRRAAHDTLATELGEPRVAEALDAWRRWLADPDVTSDAPRTLGPFVAKRIRKAQAKVLAAGAAITPQSPPEHLHELRKDTKRLRYLLECFGGLFPPKAHRRVVRRLKDLQDNLGEHQDAEIHLAELRVLARDLRQQADVDTDVLLAMGRLSDHLERRRQQERDDFADRFAAYDTTQTRAELDDLLRSADA